MAKIDYENNLKTVKRTLSFFWYAFIFLVFLTFAYISTGKSFDFSLFGDDWFMLRIVKFYFGPGKEYSYFSLHSYSHPWGFQYAILAIISFFFKYNSLAYFLSSFFLRIAAAFSGYWFFRYLTKERFISLLGSIFLVVGFSGAESIDWVFHMNIYLTIIFLFIFLRFLMQSYKEGWRKFFLSLPFFALAAASDPIRTHGLLPFVLFIDLFYWIWRGRKNMSFRVILFRQVCFVATFLFLQKLGFFGVYGFGRSWDFIKWREILAMINRRDFTPIIGIFSSIGNAFVPSSYDFKVDVLIKFLGGKWFRNLTLIYFLFGSVSFWIISKSTKKRIANFLISVGLLAPLLLMVAILLKTLPDGTGNYLRYIFSAYFGVLIIVSFIWSLYLLLVKKTKSIELYGLVVSFVLISTSLIVPIAFNPGVIFPSEHRYLTLSLAGLGLYIVSMLKLSVKGRTLELFLLISALLIFLHIRANRNYFNYLYPYRNVEVNNKMWNDLTSKVPNPYPDRFLLFYFDTREGEFLAHQNLLFGFNPRMSLTYSIDDVTKIPAYTTEFNEVISAVTDGKAFKRLGYKESPIQVNQVYAFKVNKDGGLVDISDQTRNKLLMNLRSLK